MDLFNLDPFSTDNNTDPIIRAIMMPTVIKQAEAANTIASVNIDKAMLSLGTEVLMQAEVNQKLLKDSPRGKLMIKVAEKSADEIGARYGLKIDENGEVVEI